MKQSRSADGFNRWTVPWAAPSGPELDALKAGTLDVPEFDLPPEQVDAYQRDGVLYLPGAFKDWVQPLRGGPQRRIKTWATSLEARDNGHPDPVGADDRLDLRFIARVRVCREFLVDAKEKQKAFILGEGANYHEKCILFRV